MNADEQLALLKRIPPKSIFEKRKERMIGMVLASATLISLAFLGYAFTVKSGLEGRIGRLQHQVDSLRQANQEQKKEMQQQVDRANAAALQATESNK